MDDLVAWLRDALDEDAAEASEMMRIYGEYGWYLVGAGVASEDPEDGKDAARHIARWDPARVLVEVAVKRTRVNALVSLARDPVPLLGMAMKLLMLEARPYAARPGFKPEWRVT